jgi:hypothetical protein
MNYFLGPKKINKNRLDEKVVKKCLKGLEAENTNLALLVKRKNGKSNFEPLIVGPNSQKVLKETMNEMIQYNLSNKSLKVV